MDELENLKVRHIEDSKPFKFSEPTLDIYDEEMNKQQLEKFLSLGKISDKSDAEPTEN